MKADRKKGRSKIFWWFLAGPVVALFVTVPWAFPHLAITETIGADVLVVEGWLEPEAMREAAQLIADSGYTKVYTTGTARPFAHLLESGRGIAYELNMPTEGVIKLEATGLPGNGFYLIAGADTLLNEPVTTGMRVYRVRSGPVEQLRLLAWGEAEPQGTPLIFVRSLSIGGINVNMLQRRSWFTRPDDVWEPAWPTFAQWARSELIRLGVPEEIITAVPAYGRPRSRSWGNAQAFGVQARMDEVEAFDVATMGVHARRSRQLFQTAVGQEVRVGVIALTDPFCTRNNWWKSLRGWLTILKEVVGAPEAEVVELKHWGQAATKNGR